jgi:hydrogenase nickel incorporation protein HypA/HybF
MHERSLVFAEAAALLTAVGDRPPESVVVTLGPTMQQPVAEAAWVDAVRDTLLEPVPVRWERAGDTLRCLACGHEYAGDALRRCVRCGGDGLVVDAAPEIRAAPMVRPATATSG